MPFSKEGATISSTKTTEEDRAKASRCQKKQEWQIQLSLNNTLIFLVPAYE
jgi:hypothetical protein